MTNLTCNLVIIISIVLFSTLVIYNCSQIDYRLLPATYDMCQIKYQDDSNVYQLIGVTYQHCCSNISRCRCCKYIKTNPIGLPLNDNTYFIGCPYYGSIYNMYLYDRLLEII